MADLSSFGTDNVEPIKAYEPLAPGWYTVIVTESELKDTQAGTGQYLKLKYQVCEGDHQGRTIFGNINLVNPNEEAVRIGLRQLAGLKLACSKPHATSSEELHDIPIQVKLKIGKAREGYELQNEIVEYKAIGGAPTQQPATAPRTTTAPAATQQRAPWLKGGAK